MEQRGQEEERHTGLVECKDGDRRPSLSRSCLRIESLRLVVGGYSSWVCQAEVVRMQAWRVLQAVPSLDRLRLGSDGDAEQRLTCRISVRRLTC